MFSSLPSHDADSPAQQRLRMVEEQLRNRGIRDERVLAAMSEVPREPFVSPADGPRAYGDFPLPIGSGQTISQPYMVAVMLERLQLQPQDRVLEVGTGTGYEAAVLGRLAAQVWTVERQPELASRAQEILTQLGYSNIHVVEGDGSRGLAGLAPFDKILVAAAAPRIPSALLQQLAEGGRLVVPVGSPHEQQLRVVRKIGDTIEVAGGDPCRFVPLVGEQGW